MSHYDAFPLNRTFGGISVSFGYAENGYGKPFSGVLHAVAQLDFVVQAFYNVQVDMPPGGALRRPRIRAVPICHLAH